MGNKEVLEDILNRFDNKRLNIKIIDSNIILVDPEHLVYKGFTPNNEEEEIVLIIPQEVIRECDIVKKNNRKRDPINKFFRLINGLVDDKRLIGNNYKGSDNYKDIALIKKPNRSYFLFLKDPIEIRNDVPLSSKVDISLINLALEIENLKRDRNKIEIEIVTYDYALQFQSSVNGICARPWKQRDIKEVYPKGWHIINLDYDLYGRVRNSFIDEREIDFVLEKSSDLMPNEFLIILPENLSLETLIKKYSNQQDINYKLIRYFGENKYFCGNFKQYCSMIYKNDKNYSSLKNLPIKPMNIFQEMAMILLYDPNIFSLFIGGTQGTGKTTLSLVSGINQMVPYGLKRKSCCEVNVKKYNSIKLIRPLIETREKGQDGIGFLPGDIREKTDPFFSPFYDILSKFYSNKQDEIENQIEKIALVFIRGRDFYNSFVILDEAQNTSKRVIKDILTRMNTRDNFSKIVILGDPEQVDYLFDRFNNGLWNTVNTIFDQNNPENKKDYRKRIGSIYLPPLEVNPRGEITAYFTRVL